MGMLFLIESWSYTNQIDVSHDNSKNLIYFHTTGTLFSKIYEDFIIFI